jgi:localization factor PodJL
MAGAQHRRAETDDCAEARSGVRTLQPHEIATAFGQIANDLSLIAQRPDEPEAQSPSLEEPWDADAADELARLYASGDAGLAQPLSGDAELQLRLARTVAQAAALRPAPQVSGIEGIEARLVGMTRTIETALARLGAGASDPSTTADAGGLKLNEAHAAELLAQAQETRAELGRLAAVEAQLGELKASLSESRIAGLIEAVVPTEEELTRFAEAAAQKAIRGRREATTDLAATARLNERTGEIQRLLTGFIDEHRRNEHQAAEALETMQQAMQHILDRIDAIEAAAIEALPENLQTREHVNPPARASSAVGSVEDARTRAGFAPPAWGELGMGDRYIGSASAFDARATGDRDAATAGAGLAAEAAGHEEDVKPFPFLGARTTSAASGYADGRLPVRPGILLAAGLAAFLLAGYWLVSGPRLRLPDDVSTQSAEQQHPGETTRSIPPALRSSAGPDVDGGGAGRRAKAAGRPDQAIEHTPPDWRKERGGEAPETQAQRMENGGTAAGTSAEFDRWTAPARKDTLQGPVGVVIEQGPTALSPEELLRLRQKQRMATISTQLGQQAANSSAAQPAVVSASEAAAGQQETRQTGEASQPRTSVELPPLMIGPHSLRHAAANGDASAQFEVAARFAEGKGVKQDFEQAATWYQRAATQGLAAAQYRLAALYERGAGIKADPARAKAWYKRAAEQGNVKAMHNLAVLSAGNGEGATVDYAAAGRWFTEAAAHGLADSQYNLGILYENGLGVGKDYAAAYKWYALAARSGDKEALRRRELVKERLSPAAIKATEMDIAAWRALTSDQLVNDARTVGEAWKGRAAGSPD